MTGEQIMEIFKDTAYIRTGGSPEELRCAEYLLSRCAPFGQAVIEPFAVQMADLEEATLTLDGKEYPCKGYKNAGNGTVEAPFYYLRDSKDACALGRCKGKIVLIDGYLGHWVYQDLLSNGAVGFITYDGNANYIDHDMDQRELRASVANGNKIPGVNINAKDAIAIVNSRPVTAKIVLKQKEYEGESRNVILDLPGEIPETIVFTAHYDSTSLSQGAYDNMSGSIGLLAMAEYFSKNPHRHGLRFVWCGSEERGLLGSKAYCAAHEGELSNVVLNINLDMIGCIMGKFIACCTSEDALTDYIRYLARELGFGISASQGVYSSDSTPFADKGVPAVSFARIAPSNTATIHNSYDTMALLQVQQMVEDIDFITAFASRMANAVDCPVKREMPDNMKEKLDEYLTRKRPAANP